MDDFAAEMLASTHDDDHQVRPSSSSSAAAAPVAVQEEPPVTPPRQGGLRGGLAAIREKASLQDRLVEKYLVHIARLLFAHQ